MTDIFIIVFKNDNELLSATECIMEKISQDNNDIIFLGSWGEIQYNREECLNAIYSAVSNSVNNYKVIYFGCSVKDVAEIKQTLINRKHSVKEVLYKEFLRFL